MARIEIKCATCGKHVGTKTEIRTKTAIIRQLTCGHTYVEKLVVPTAPPGEKLLCLTCRVEIGTAKAKDHIGHNTVSVPIKRDHRWLEFFPYQREGIVFIERSNFRCLLGDEMGLGKTVQIIGALRYNYEALKPVLVTCPAGVIYNWQKEFKFWFSDKYKEFEDTPIVHLNTSGNLVEGMQVQIVSSSILSRPELLKEIRDFGFKTLVIDESHQFKNDDSARTEALMKISEVVPYRICASGTSVLNRTSEYFNTLHLIKPEHWPHYGYLSRMLTFVKGKEVGLAPYHRDRFFAQTSGYIIRRKKADVYQDLPELLTPKQFINVATEEKFVNMYNNQLDELDELIARSQSRIARSNNFMQVIALIQQLRQTVGLMKVKPLVARIREFLENTDETDKLTVGVHHIMVRELLEQALKEYNPISISDEPPQVKDRKQAEFMKLENRLLLASIIGAGTGRNLQFCHNAIIGEREWNLQIERQFEGRFQRPIKCLTCDILTVPNGKKGIYKCPKCGTEQEIDHVIVDRLVAKGTIDEFFDDLCELKGQIADGTLEHDFSSNQEFIYELAEKAIASRLKYVGGR